MRIHSALRRWLLTVCCLTFGAGGLDVAVAEEAAGSEEATSEKSEKAVLSWQDGDEGPRLLWKGDLITALISKDLRRPVFHPLILPEGSQLTRNWPLSEPMEGEKTDHPHHKGVWFCHGDVNGVDFWTDSESGGVIQLKEIKEKTAKDGAASVTMLNEWIAPGGVKLLDEVRRVDFAVSESGELTLDWDITLRAAEGQDEVIFGETKEGSMAIRAAAWLTPDTKDSHATLLESGGKSGADSWGARGPWALLTAPAPGMDHPISVAMLAHPENPGAPCWWHIRTYGLFAANPFGGSHMEKDFKGDARLILKKGQEARFRFRIICSPESLDSERLTEESKFAESR